MTHVDLFKHFAKAFPMIAEGAESYANVRNDKNSITVLMKSKRCYKFTVTDKEYILKVERRRVK